MKRRRPYGGQSSFQSAAQAAAFQEKVGDEIHEKWNLHKSEWEHLFNYVASPDIADEMEAYRKERREKGFPEYELTEEEKKRIRAESEEEWAELLEIMEDVEDAHYALENEAFEESMELDEL